MKKVNRTNQVTFSRAEIIEALRHQGWQIPTEARMFSNGAMMTLNEINFSWSESHPADCIAMKAKEA